MTLAAPQSAAAYQLNGKKWPSGNIAYRNFTSSLYLTASSGAISSWDTLTDANLTSSSTGTLTIATNYANDGNAGTALITSNGFGTISSVAIKGNTYYMASYSANKKRFVMAHEIGHALGLAHAGASTVMAASAAAFDQYGIYTPTGDDRAGVNSLY